MTNDPQDHSAAQQQVKGPAQTAVAPDPGVWTARVELYGPASGPESGFVFPNHGTHGCFRNVGYSANPRVQGIQPDLRHVSGR